VARHNDRDDWGDTARLVQDCHHFDNDFAINVIVSPPTASAEPALRAIRESLAQTSSMSDLERVDKKGHSTIFLQTQIGTLELPLCPMAV